MLSIRIIEKEFLNMVGLCHLYILMIIISDTNHNLYFLSQHIQYAYIRRGENIDQIILTKAFTFYE